MIRTLLFIFLTISAGLVHAQHRSLDAIDESNLVKALSESVEMFDAERPAALSTRAAVIHRHLQQLSPEERYEVLKDFTLPQSAEEDIACFASLCNVDAPPREFARAIAKRPTAGVFAAPSVGDTAGVFSTAWLLVSTAKEVGRLHELSEQINGRSGPNADYVTLLLAIAGARGIDATTDQNRKDAWIQRLKTASNAIAIQSVVVAAVAADSETHTGLVNSIASIMDESATVSRTLKQMTREINFIARSTPGLQSCQLSRDWIRMPGKSLWHTHEGHLTQTSAGPSSIMYRYPIRGEFHFQFEQLSTGNSDANLLGYDGTDVGWEGYRRPEINRRAVEKHADSVRFWVNGHPVRTTSATGGSPWLMLQCEGMPNHRFRNFKLAGDPVVPDDVSLIGDDSRNGWTTIAVDNDHAMWSVNGGELHSVKAESSPRQRLLRYVRPLLNQETIEYEFFASSEAMVHPAVGKLAFMFEPDGVKVHWVTDGDLEWTGLPPDNALVEPLSRRGPRPLPLRDNQWNRVVLKRNDDNVAITLNETLVYERSIEELVDTRFGFYHDPSNEEVLVRAAKLRGDWPRTIDPDAWLGPEGNPDQVALNSAPDLFPESVLRTNTRATIALARGMEPGPRYEFLSDWVLPSPSRPTFRLTGHFVPLDSAGPQPEAPIHRRDHLVAPATELISLANELGRLPELAAKIEQSPNDSRDQKRARAAMLALVWAAQDNVDTANRHLEALFELVNDEPKLTPDQLWPEVLVVHGLADESKAANVLIDLLTILKPAAFNDANPVGTELLGVLQSIQFRLQPEGVVLPRIEPQLWIASSPVDAAKRSGGGEPADWIATPGQIQAIGGQGIEQIFFRYPLTGDFEFEFQHSLNSNTPCQVLVGGESHQLNSWQIKHGPIDGQLVASKLAPNVSTDGFLMHQRYSVKNGICTIFANGREVFQHSVQPGFPWIAIRQGYKQSTQLRDLRITGSPTIPAEVRLDSEGLIGWRSYYHRDATIGNSPWRQQDGEIVGKHGTKSAGSGDEQMLYYERPLSEDASIRYQFFYRPGETIVYPVLDRITFVLDRDNVAVHLITDGYFDETFADKTNRRVEPSDQRTAPGDLLQNDDWNSIELFVRGNSLDMQLNGESIYVSQLEPKTGRTFGLFYDADQSSARAKEVVLRGDWPAELPVLARQRLADQTVVQLDASRDGLESRFEHDFTSEGMPSEFFSIAGAQNANIAESGDGVSFSIRSPEKWTQSSLLCNLKMQGDFDVSVDYSDLKLESGESALAKLIVPFASSKSLEGRISRDVHGQGKSVINAQLHSLNPNGSPNQVNKQFGWESTSGTMRIARRGKRLHILIKDDTSSQFRHLESYKVPDAPTQKIGLLTVAQRAELVSVTWRKIVIHAEQLSQIGGASGDNRIFVARADGSDIRQITKTTGDLGNHGSPEFSPDGTKVAFDTWTGSSKTAHIFIVNIDGTGLRDLGLGLMPTFSHDGKQIAFSTLSGMTMMDIDGSNRRVVSQSGWGIQISPLGDQVAFTDYGDGGHNLYALDLKTNEKRALLAGKSVGRYSQIYWNFDWSPDGKELCFCGSNRESGQRELAVVSVNGSQQTFQTLRTGGNYGNIAWHPDGDHIMFIDNDRAYGNMSMFMINRDGTAGETPLLEDRRMATIAGGEWSRDGKMIAIASSVMKTFSKPKSDSDLGPQLDETRDKLPANFSADLSNMAANIELLKVSDGGSTLNYGPQGISISTSSNSRKSTEIAPQMQMIGDFDVEVELDELHSEAGAAGETRLVVPFMTDEKIDLQIIHRTNVDGRSSLQARGVRGNQELFRESVSSDGGYSGLRIARRGMTSHLLCRDSESSDYRVIASFETGDIATRPWGLKFVASSAIGQALNVNLTRFSIQADKLLLTDRSQKQFRRVHSVNIDGTEQRELAGDIAGLGGHGSPKFSPDGTQVAFDTFNHGFGSSHVILVNADGTNQRDLGQGSMPTFFPDGKRLAFTCNDGLMTMNVDGSNRQLIRRTGHSIKVSRDGKRYAFIDYSQIDGRAVQNLFVMDVSSDQPTPLLVGADANLFSEIQWNGAWSADGSEFAFRGKSRADREYQLVVVNTAASDHAVTVLRKDSRYTCDLDWHPDGKRIFVSRQNEKTGGFQLVLVPRDPYLPDELIAGQNPYDENFSSGVSQDGKQLVFTSNPLPAYEGDQ